jgi:hypothetical protein
MKLGCVTCMSAPVAAPDFGPSAVEVILLPDLTTVRHAYGLSWFRYFRVISFGAQRCGGSAAELQRANQTRWRSESQPGARLTRVTPASSALGHEADAVALIS